MKVETPKMNKIPLIDLVDGTCFMRPAVSTAVAMKCRATSNVLKGFLRESFEDYLLINYISTGEVTLLHKTELVIPVEMEAKEVSSEG